MTGFFHLGLQDGKGVSDNITARQGNRRSLPKTATSIPKLAAGEYPGRQGCKRRMD